MRSACAVLSGLLLLHCGKSTAGGNGSTSSGAAAGASSTGSTASSAASGSSGATGSDSGSSSGASVGSASSSGSSSGDLSYHGAVFFLNTTLPLLGTTHAIAAAFVDQNSPIPNDPSDCTNGTQVESCCYHGQLPAGSSSSSSTAASTTSSGSSSSSGSTGSASSSGSTGTTGASTTQYSAGVIMLTDAATTLGTMTPSASGTYAPLTTATWAVGDSLTAAGAGDPSAVPAFSGTATAPPAVDITSPVAGGTFSPAQVSVSHALVVQWDGTGGTNVYTFLYTASGGATPTITCKTGDVGHVTIPSTIMAALAGQLGGALAVGRANSSDASSANSQVTVYALTANGIAVQFTP